MSATTIYLIQPPVLFRSLREEDPPVLPLGLSLVASALKKRGWTVRCFDIRIDTNNMDASAEKARQQIFPRILSDKQHKAVMRFIQKGETSPFVDRLAQAFQKKYILKDAAVVGISVYETTQFLWALFIARLVGERAPVLFGGAFFGAMGSVYFERFDLMKYLVVGPGERSICEFMECLKGQRLIENVTGLIYKQAGKVISNESVCARISDMPILDPTVLDLDKYRLNWKGSDLLMVPYQISAGCFNHCSFCSDHGSGFRYKPLKKVLSEVPQLLEESAGKLVVFAESNLYFSYDYLMGLCDGLIEQKVPFLWGSFSGIVDAKGRVMDRALIRKMKASGCRFFSFGLETGSDVLRKKMGKNFTAKQAGEVLKLCHEEGINVMVFFMVGYPGETQEDVAMTLDFIKRYGKYMTLTIPATFALPYGTPMFNNPEQYGIRIVKPLRTRILKPVYEFVEVGGGSYAQRRRVVSKRFKRISKALYYYSARDHFGIKGPIPFWAYDLVKKTRAKNNTLTVLINAFLKLFRPELHKTYQYPFLLKYGLLDKKEKGEVLQ